MITQNQTYITFRRDSLRIPALLATVLSTVCIAFAVPQTISSTNCRAVVGQPFIPSYFDGAGTGSWQFCIANETNWDPSSATKGGTIINGAWTSSWTPGTTGTRTFWIARTGDGTYDMAISGPYSVDVIASQPGNIYSFKVLVDTNQINFDGQHPQEETLAGTYAGDGAWFVRGGGVPTSPYTTDATWQTVILPALNASRMLITEDQYDNLYYRTTASNFYWARSHGFTVNAQFSNTETSFLTDPNASWMEDGSGGSDSNDCVLLYNSDPNGSPLYYKDSSPLAGQRLPDEFSLLRAAVLNNAPSYPLPSSLIAETRQWENLSWIKQYSVNAMASPNCGGFCFEIHPDVAYMRERDIAGGLQYIISHGRVPYILLSPLITYRRDEYAGFNDYLASVQRTVRELAKNPASLNATYIVLAAYRREYPADSIASANVGFLTGDSYTDANNCVYAAVNWVKAFRAGLVQ